MSNKETTTSSGDQLTYTLQLVMCEGFEGLVTQITNPTPIHNEMFP